jgi:molybdopterin synthase catalytic subunit
LIETGPESGAIVTFDGVVRNLNEGRKVDRLAYEAYGELAVKEGAAILEEAKERFPIQQCACEHRVGALEIGDVAIRVQVLAGHRAEAFDACRWIVDQVKYRVPIWKKEFYSDGESAWLEPVATSRELDM